VNANDVAPLHRNGDEQSIPRQSPGLRATHSEVSNKMITNDKHSIVNGMMFKCFGCHDEGERKARQTCLGTTSAGKSDELTLADHNGLVSLNGVI
jgi:hypothetical protein